MRQGETDQRHGPNGTGTVPELGGWPFGRVLMLVIGGVVLLATSLFGLLIYEVRSSYIEKRIYAELETWRDNKIRDIQRWASGMLRFGEIVAADQRIVDICREFQAGLLATGSHHPTLVEKITRYQFGKEISLYQIGTGHPFCTSGNGIATAHELPRDLVERAVAARKVVISDVFLCPLTGVPSIQVVAPVFAGNTLEPLALAGYLFDVDELYNGILKGIPLGETGEIVLTNASGVVQSPLRFMPDAPTRRAIRTEMMDMARAGVFGRKEGADYRGKPVVSAYGHIPELRWGMVAKQDLDELRQPLRELRNQAIFLTLFVTFLGAIFGTFLARIIAGPAIKLASISRRVAAGESGLRAEPEGITELRQISDGFNRMLEALDREAAVVSGVNRLLLSGASHAHLERLFGAMLPDLMEECRSQIAVAYIRDFEAASFRRVKAIGCPEERFPDRFRLDTIDSWLAQVAGRNEPCVIDHWPHDRAVTLPIPGGEIALRGLLGIPVKRDQESIAVIGLVSIHEFRPQDLQIAGQLSRIFAPLILTCQANERNEELTMELQSSNQELTATNEELQAQSEELQAQATHLHALTRELDVKRRQVEEADRLKSEFLSSMSHELRTPLNSILALSQLMSTRGPGKKVEQDREYLAVIERNGRHLLELINDILDLSKIEAGRMEVTSASFDPKATVHRAVATIRPLAEEKKLNIRVDVERLPEIVSDEGKLWQITLNLLSNAVKFTEAGMIEIEGRIDGQDLFILFRDSGIGIPDKDQAKLFEKFRQIDGSNTRRHAGTGLGLAISRKLARLLGGDITCTSKEGSGSTFSLVLPLVHGQRGESDDPVISMELAEAVPSSQNPYPELPEGRPVPDPDARKSLLIVDDNNIAAMQIQSVLEREGYAISVARNGAEAMTAVEQSAPDAVILDLMMPGVNGFEFLERLRSRPEFGWLPVMVLTAQELTSSDRSTLARLRVVEVVQKGAVDRTALVKCVGRVIGQPRSVPTRLPEKPAAGRAHPDILLVEDNYDNLFTLREILNEFEADLVVAANGEEAVQIVRDRLPGLILMDIHLPGKSGLEALAELRANPRTASIPVVAMTARAMKGDREEFLLKGFDEYLPKPLDPVATVEVVRHWLGRKKED